jgi:23S rRNA-intervening sequence protein
VYVAKEMDDILRPGQQGNVSQNDDTVETVVYKSQQAAKQLCEGFHRSSPETCSQPDHRTEDRWKSRDGRDVKDFNELKVWQKAHELTLAIYRVTVDFPRAELYGLRANSDLRAHRSGPIWPRGAVEAVTPSSPASAPSRWDLSEYHLLVARDLKLFKPRDYENWRRVPLN